MKKSAALFLFLILVFSPVFAATSNVARAGGSGGSSDLSDFAQDFSDASFADDQVFVADDVNGGTPRTITNCVDTGGNHLNYTQATNSFSCGTSSSVSSGFTLTSSTINPTLTSYSVGIGSSAGASLGRLSVDGKADENQLVIQGHSTQTSNVVVIEKSDGTDLVTVDNSGNTMILGTLTVGGSGSSATFGDSSTATYGLIGALSGSNDPTLTFIDGGWKWGATSEDVSAIFTSNTLTNSSSTGVNSIVYTSIGLTAANLTDGALTSGRVTFASTSGLLADDADMTFATDTLTVAKIIGSTSITDSGLTSTRVTFSGASGLLSDDADLTFTSGDTLTATKIAATTLTGNATLAENSSVALDPAGSADGKYSGITVTGTGGATIAFGDLVTLDKDDSRWELVDVSVAAAATGDARGTLGMAVTSSSDGAAITVLLQGIIRADANFPTMTIGAEVFATTAGDITSTQPTTVDYVIRRVGSALTGDELYFDPDHFWYTHT